MPGERVCALSVNDRANSALGQLTYNKCPFNLSLSCREMPDRGVLMWRQLA